MCGIQDGKRLIPTQLSWLLFYNPRVQHGSVEQKPGELCGIHILDTFPLRKSHLDPHSDTADSFNVHLKQFWLCGNLGGIKKGILHHHDFMIMNPPLLVVHVPSYIFFATGNNVLFATDYIAVQTGQLLECFISINARQY